MEDNSPWACFVYGVLHIPRSTDINAWWHSLAVAAGWARMLSERYEQMARDLEARTNHTGPWKIMVENNVGRLALVSIVDDTMAAVMVAWNLSRTQPFGRWIMIALPDHVWPAMSLLGQVRDPALRSPL